MLKWTAIMLLFAEILLQRWSIVQLRGQLEGCIVGRSSDTRQIIASYNILVSEIRKVEHGPKEQPRPKGE